jgi:hypothetical protein
MDTKQDEVTLADKSGAQGSDPRSPRTGGGSTLAKKRVAADEPKNALGSATKKPAQPSRRSARPTSKAKKVVCRYCGSYDLAASFKKRRYARCRACFKKRYGSTARKRTGHTRKAKATK